MKLRYFQFFGSLHPILYFATSPNATAGGAGSGEGGGGSATTGTAAPGSGAAPPSTPATIDWKTAPDQFRQGYEKLKGDYDKLTGEFKPWQDWAKEANVTPDQLQSIHGTHQQVFEEINAIAEELGRSEDEIVEAIEKHGVIKVLDYLRDQYAKTDAQRSDPNANIEDVINQALEQRMGPIEQRENQRLTDAANDRFEQIVHSSIVEAYKAEGIDPGQIPEQESFMLMNATSEILKYDEKALVELKQGKGQAAVQKAFQQAKTFLDQYYLSRSGRERGRIQGPPKVKAADGQQRRPTLDEMIEEPTLINTKYKVGQ